MLDLHGDNYKPGNPIALFTKKCIAIFERNDINKLFRAPGLDSTFCNPGTAV